MATLFKLPENHPQRFQLHNEVHARSSVILQLPVRASHFALMPDGDDKKREWQHLVTLCNRFALVPPEKNADHFNANFGNFQFRWEQHGEFSTYTFYAQFTGEEPFANPALEEVPVDWMAGLSGHVVVAAHATIMPTEAYNTEISTITSYFAGNSVIGAEMSGSAARAFTDFRIHIDGFSRFLILNDKLQPGQAGRLLLRLFEIEVYRVMALMARPIARELAPKLQERDQQLLNITTAMSQPDSKDEELLDELVTLAAEIEHCMSTSYFRFSAASAYYKLVEQRIEDLREVRIQGIQTIGEFMKRRLEPAINTCNTTANRLNKLSHRISNAGELLRTRVDITIEHQNQALLTSMNQRAKTQLRLQETVESLSIVAITTYVSTLVGSIAKAAQASGWPVNPAIITGISIPIILLAVAISVRRIHKMIQKSDN